MRGNPLGIRETLIETLKDLVLPGLDRLKGEVGKLAVLLGGVEAWGFSSAL